MLVERPTYLKKLIAKQNNGLIKIVTGLRRCGKSFLLLEIFCRYLRSVGIADEQMIVLALDELQNVKYRNPFELDKYLRSRIQHSNRQYYVFIDEIQKVQDVQNPWLKAEDKIGFVDVLLGLMKFKNVDLYVTGSNSRLLSSDILTEFRGRGDEIRVAPLSYKEFCSAFPKNTRGLWKEYCRYGGMPYVLSLDGHEAKSGYLKDLFAKTYLTDVIEHNRILNDEDKLETLLNVLSSAVGSLTNPAKLSRSFASAAHENISPATISRYIDYFENAFLISKAQRFDIKGKRYIGTPLKYYFTDAGLRNARLNFRQTEENHLMENIIYNELSVRGFDLDIGVIEQNYKGANGGARQWLEIDFIAGRGDKRYYIQSAFNIDDAEKKCQKTHPLAKIPDSFKKMVVVKDDIIPGRDENGVFYIGIEDFLLDENSIDL